MLRESRSGARSTSPRAPCRAGVSASAVAGRWRSALAARLRTLQGAGRRAAEGCKSNRTFFETQVWSPFMGSLCYKCHGHRRREAEVQGAKFQLEPATFPDFVTHESRQHLTMIVNITDHTTGLQRDPAQADRRLKPRRRRAVIDEGRPPVQGARRAGEAAPVRHGYLRRQAERADPAVKLMDAPTTLRKAALDIAGRLPTKAELDTVDEGRRRTRSTRRSTT